MKPYRLEMQTRDYECDMHGIVNNAVYVNYFEHARHSFLESRGIRFIDLTLKEKITVVVTQLNVTYKSPLRGGDNFYVTVSAQKKSRLLIDFIQKIYLLPEEKLCAEAITTVVGLNQENKPYYPEILDKILDEQ